MHGMLTASMLLMDTRLTPEQKELAHIIEESGSVLLQVINDILDYSKLASGSFTVNTSTISVLDIISAVVRASQATLREGVVIQTEIDDNVPKNVQSDPLRYRQVLQNIVGNAIKFTEKGNIRIVTSVQKEDDSCCILMTEVIDTGIGVPHYAVDALFTPFSQFDNSTTKRYKGTGLGLSICKSLVELMGGHIGFRPNPERGSTFWFTTRLEKVKANGPHNGGTMTPQPSTVLKEGTLAKQILVVEDNIINQTIMVKLLKGFGFKHIDVALNGADAVKTIKTKPLAYGLILMDINMPVMDGIAATKQIRGMGLELPIIAMTANALKGDEEQYLGQGMDDYVAKPVDRRLLLRTMLKWLEH
jgi:osomolarity two-component system sensor histidine kinase TcsA